MTTFSFRKKYITRLFLEDGSYITDHNQKAQALWLSFMDRMGQSEFNELSYNLAELLQRVVLICLILTLNFQWRKFRLICLTCHLIMLLGMMVLMVHFLRNIGILLNWTL